MDSYSRWVSWLKVLLPMMALALLATMFLLSRNVDPTASIPFAETEIAERLRGQQVTAPFFSGTTTSGDQVTIAAGTMMTVSDLNNAVQDLSAQIDLASGTRIVLTANTGTFDMTRGASALEGDVIITTSGGMRLMTDVLETDFEDLAVESPGPVQGVMPAGTLRAGKMRLTRDPKAENAHLIFTNGVKLIYDPGLTEE